MWGPNKFIRVQTSKCHYSIVYKCFTFCFFYGMLKVYSFGINTDDRQYFHNFHKIVVDNFYAKRQNWTTSHLGTILFKKHNEYVFYHQQTPNKVFHVLLWNYQSYFKPRFKRFPYGHTRDVSLNNCDVHNCIFYGNNSLISAVDAVVVPTRSRNLPSNNMRDPKQKWIFYTDESPLHSFSTVSNKRMSMIDLADLFNWSMTYRSDSDIPIPYGRTVPLEYPIHIPALDFITELVPNWSKKTNVSLVTTLMYNCNIRYRKKIIAELSKYIKIDIYGGCGSEDLKALCPGNSKDDCKYLFNYYFYLAFENSMCRQYLTEKTFYNAFTKGAIPIIQGPPLSDCIKILPPHSFIHVDQYSSIKDLAMDILFISESKERLLSYHVWRAHFEVTNEGGFFSPDATGFCRVCQALNFNPPKKAVYRYDDLRIFLDAKLLCNLSYTPNVEPPIPRNMSKSSLW